MKVSKREDFAIILMSMLARTYSKGFVSLSEMAGESQLSGLFLKHIAMKLKKAGLILSREGISGGYMLSRDPGEITVDEILRAISNGILITPCEKGSCRVKREVCTCFPVWGKLNAKISEHLKTLTLANIARV
jgi:Rrf2 family protein